MTYCLKKIKEARDMDKCNTSDVSDIAGKVVRRLIERGISEDVAQAEVAKLYPQIISNAVH